MVCFRYLKSSAILYNYIEEEIITLEIRYMEQITSAQNNKIKNANKLKKRKIEIKQV